MNNQDNIVSKIDTWLKSQGYPLEMIVSKKLNDFGFSVKQSYIYTDPETTASREIDVVADIDDESGTKTFSIVIECKVTRDKPWILFTGEDVLSGYSKLFSHFLLTQRARDFFADNVSRDRFLDQIAIIREVCRCGYGLTQAFTSGKDIAHDASISISKAVISKKFDDEKEELREAIMPVIIIDGRLFECFLDENYSVKISEIEEGLFFQARSMNGLLVPSIRVVTVKRLEGFITETLDVIRRVFEVI